MNPSFNNASAGVIAGGLLLAMMFAGCTSNSPTGFVRKSNTGNVAAENIPLAKNSGDIVDLRSGQAHAADYEMRVESDPSGSQVVIDGVPLAKTPCRVLMSGSPSGFFLDTHSVKVRFIALDDQHESQTVEEAFSKHDKIPTKLRFTAEGATRTLRDK